MTVQHLGINIEDPARRRCRAIPKPTSSAFTSNLQGVGAWEYHSNLELIKSSDAKFLRMVSNERTAAALKAKGYHYRFLTGKGAKHCSDGRVQETSMPDSLVWVWRGYPNDL